MGPGLQIARTVLKRIKARKVGNYVASIMGATLSREHMATHSYKGQKGKNGKVKPRLDPVFTKSLIGELDEITHRFMYIACFITSRNNDNLQIYSNML